MKTLNRHPDRMEMLDADRYVLEFIADKALDRREFVAIIAVIKLDNTCPRKYILRSDESILYSAQTGTFVAASSQGLPF